MPTTATSSSITTTTEAKMEFLKRKHFSLWIITLILAALVDLSNGLQGVPTWMCLGIKSPFIEFSNEIEVLANTSVSLNITKDEQALMHQEGLKKLGTFIKPVDLRDATTGFVKANLTKKLPPTLPGNRKRGHLNPIQEEMEQKQIVLLDEDTDENGLPASLTEEDRKFIVPMALKNVTPDPRLPSTTSTSTTTSTTTTTTTTATPDFASNIDDLKNHILFLQNMTKHNINFQSKFVVFPSLQKEKGPTATAMTSTTTTTTTPRPLFRYTPPIPPPTRRATFHSYATSSTPRSHQFDHYFDHEDPMVAVQREKITIVPQVLLLNDQTPPDDNEEDSRRLGDHKDQRVIYSKRRNFRKSSTPPSVTTTNASQTTLNIPEKPFRRNPKRPRNNGEKRNKNQRKPCKNPDSPKCQRQRRRQEQQQMLEQQQQQYQPFQPFLQTINNTRRFAVSIEIPDSFKIKQNETKEPSAELKLSRIPRSHHNRRNIGAGYGSTYYDAPAKDFIMSGGQLGGLNNQMFLNNTPNPTVAAYSEPIDLNPDLCYDVDALTYGQKKICVMHPSVMPAISRGARSAIQECQHQFKNRRWNCSTTDDNSVFGPMSSLGSPEMAFIHALASATVTSFIARACRDGQLASCGCSRGARPRQLHDDWAWGGCGDDLEYAYKFSQDFIDIREKERKRGTRGLASGPRIKNDEKSSDKPPPPPASSNPTEKKNITATDAASASSSRAPSSGPLAEQQNGTTSTTLRTLQDGHANITVNVDSDNKNNSSSSSSFTGSSSFSSSVNKDTMEREEDSTETGSRFKPEDLLELQERITKEILNSKLQEKEMLELQEKINREILNSKVFNLDHYASMYGKKKKNQRAVNSMGNGGNNMMGVMGNGNGGGAGPGRLKNVMSVKARSLMNLHNNEAGRRAVIKKTRITCKCHGVSGSCSLITCWQQLSSIREIGDYLRERYDEATEVKLNKRGRLQVKDPQFKVPTAHDLVYLDESPDWCRNNRQLQWPGTHGRICNKTSSGLDGCGILCCGRGYNTKNIVVRERCNCKFHWCCQVKCDICVKVLEEHTCK